MRRDADLCVIGGGIVGLATAWRFVQRYERLGATDFGCLVPDDPALAANGGARRRAAAEVMASDVVYLAGGNTARNTAIIRSRAFWWSGLIAMNCAGFAPRSASPATLSPST